MTTREIRVVHPDDPVKLTLGAGDEYRYLATGKETDGAYFLIEAIVPPGGGPIPHIQTREEEAFYILSGEVTFYGEGGEILAGPGTYLNVPKGAKHSFRNNSDQVARMLFFFVPAGIERLFALFETLAAPADDPAAAIASLNKMAEPFGVQYFLKW